MWNAFAYLLGLREMEAVVGKRETGLVPEPEFKPFVFPEPERVGDAKVERLEATAPPESPRTLNELGVPEPLASDIEFTLRMMGMVVGDRVVGYSFRTPDGRPHALRVAPPEKDVRDRAA
ncbi:MAG TPA: hypothetical protein VFG59_11165 [Anaeromyxobacter sp.]|nr:hypothetical protein [Anaeromyxobacter sp.]